MNEISYYYIGNVFIEEEKSANQIQRKNTFENLKKINSSFKRIFLGNQKK